MGLQQIFDSMDNPTLAPIEIIDIVSVIKRIGLADEVEIKKVQTDQKLLKGLYSEVEDRTSLPYAESIRTIRIWYEASESSDFEEASAENRLTCAKELVHVLDTEIFSTSVVGDANCLARNMIKILSGFKSIEANPDQQHQVIADVLAEHKAYSLLCPPSLRKIVVRKMKNGLSTVEQLARDLSITEKAMGFLLADTWEEFERLILD